MSKIAKMVSLALLIAAPATLAFGQDAARVLPVEIDPDVVYGHKMGMALTFDVLRPAKANGAGVLFMVSGGWFSRWAPPETLAERLDDLLASGFTVFAVRHGSSPLFKVPDAVDDVRRATRHIRANADEWDVDPERLGVFGASAGGHLSLMLGTTGDAGDPTSQDPVLRESSRVAAVVAYFPPVDLSGITGPNDRFPALDFDASLAPSVSPIFHVSADDVPSLMIHGDKDDLVPLRHSERIVEAFKSHGVTTDLIVIAGAGHGFEGEHRDTASEAMVGWFEKHLGAGAAAAPETQATGQ
jgi:acetyl esterase/lipase